MKKFADFNESTDFKPHLMYKDGKEQKANTHAMHLKLKSDGWSHEKLDESYPLTLMDNITESSYSIKVSQAWKKVKSLPNVRGISNSGQNHAKKLSSLLKGGPDKVTFEKLELALGTYEVHAYTAAEDKKNPHGKEDLVKLQEFCDSVDEVIGAMKNLHQSQLPEGFMDTMKQLLPGAKGKPQKLPKGKKTAMENQFPYARLSVHRMIVALRKAKGTAMKGKAQPKDRRENESSLGYILAHVEDIARTRHAEQPNSGRQIHDAGNIDDATQQYFMDKIRQNDWTKADQEILDAMVGNGTDDYTKGGAYHAKTLAHDIALSVKYAKKDAGIKESVDEALNMQQRMARGRQMKRNKSKLARGRLKAAKRTASKDVLAKRARKAARSAILSKMTKGMSKSELSPARKRELEKKLEKPAFATKISRVAQKLLPKMRKTEIARRANRNKGSSN